MRRRTSATTEDARAVTPHRALQREADEFVAQVQQQRHFLTTYNECDSSRHNNNSHIHREGRGNIRRQTDSRKFVPSSVTSSHGDDGRGEACRRRRRPPPPQSSATTYLPTIISCFSEEIAEVREEVKTKHDRQTLLHALGWTQREFMESSHQEVE